MERSQKIRQILVIDPHADHVQTIQNTLKQRNVDCEVVAIAQNAEAIAYLRRQGPYLNAPRPDLILLDINITQEHSPQAGFEILTTIKAEPQLKRIPVVVLTLSGEDTLIFNSYALQGNCYVIKSSD
ncbi:MAG: response regulator, partial [Merismopedia sp. SIO2A8]|nr:response regulator [Merismopedia sp. SIO2A8]